VIVSAILALAWGALAFGAVYPWAYWPLFGVAAMIGVAGLIDGRRRNAPGWPLALGGLLFVAAVGLQLVPLPRSVVTAISPRMNNLLQQIDIGWAAGVTETHALSIDPASTTRALAGLVALVLFTAGLSRALTPKRAHTLASGIISIGALMALAGIVQRSTGTSRIYGFWVPYDHPYQIFGPFVNKNHFAGWTIMALSLAVGVVCGRLATAMSGVRRDWRSRVLWWSSPDASQLLLAAGAIVIMAFAIVLTRSRSGNICLGIVVLLGVLITMKETRAGGRGARGLAAAVVISVLALAAIGWAGAGPVVERLQNDAGLDGRLDAWRAALRIASDFPLAGTGVNTFATAMLFYQPPQLTARWDFAHNDYLQLAAEGGGLLVAASVFIIVAAVREAVRRIRAPQDPQTFWVRVGAVLGLAGIAVQETVDFSLHLPGIALLFATLTAFTLFATEP
jgi:O-antigen ligase